jgi:peptide/nickel transport system ATP-binding protein
VEKMDSDLLQVEGLSAFYEAAPKPVRAVNNVTFSLKRKEVLGICGESGCGKTTLLKAITGLLKEPGYIHQGRIMYNNIDLSKLSEQEFRRVRWKEISYIPQASMNSLNPVLNVRSQMVDTIRAHDNNVSEAEIVESLKKVLDEVLLSSDTLEMYPHELSGGMKQRILIGLATGAATIHPKIIVADEPTSNLDVTTERYILKIFRELIKNSDTSVLFVTHNIAAQSQIADRLIIMYAGEIMEIGDVSDVFNNPLHPYTKALISATPSIDDIEKTISLPGLPPDLRDPPVGCNFHPRCPVAITGKCDFEDSDTFEVESGRYVKCHHYKGKEDK